MSKSKKNKRPQKMNKQMRIWAMQTLKELQVTESSVLHIYCGIDPDNNMKPVYVVCELIGEGEMIGNFGTFPTLKQAEKDFKAVVKFYK